MIKTYSQSDKKTIVKFSKRKVCQQVLRVKEELKNIDPSELDFPEGTAIFINESLCSYYKMLWNKCKKLWEKKLIYTYFTSNGNIRYSIRENGNVNTVTHITDLKKNFPDIDINDLSIISYHYCSLILVFEKHVFGMSLRSLESLIQFFCGFSFENTLFTLF